MQLERRKYLRVPEEAEITYKVLPDFKTSMFITKDIGQGGLCFYVQEAIAENTLLEVRFNVEKIPFSFKTIVKARWLKRVPNAECYEVGVEFVNMPDHAAQHLMQYIKSFSEKDTY